jgi:hypothetical protein
MRVNRDSAVGVINVVGGAVGFLVGVDVKFKFGAGVSEGTVDDLGEA